VPHGRDEKIKFSHVARTCFSRLTALISASVAERASALGSGGGEDIGGMCAWDGWLARGLL
jgi:hypothetical protein